jgi:hypothetical protein
MQRKLLIVMMLTAVLAGAGCRRAGGAKKPPVSVEKESDFLYTRKGDVIGAGLDPIAKKGRLSAEEEKLAQVAAEIAAKLKAEADKKKRSDDTIALGNFLRAYRTANPSPTNYSLEKVRITLRRDKKFELYDEVDKKNIEVPYLVDWLNPSHIIAYHKTAETQDDLATKKTVDLGHPTVFTDGTKFEFIKAADLDRRIKDQELLICWQYYVQFATPHYYRTSAEFGPYVPSALTGTPPVFLSKIKGRSPDLLKNPPDERNLDRFKKYLSESAPPYLLKLVVDNTLCVSMKADLWNPSELVACRDKAEGKDKDGKEKGQLAIDASANIQPYEAEQMKLWIAQKKN